jgi:hypothetical protein
MTLRPACWLIWLACALFPLTTNAETLRVATWNVELNRDGPGLLLRDLLANKDPQIEAVFEVLTATRPDVLALQGFDYDFESMALQTFGLKLQGAGLDYPYLLALPTNRGLMTDLDLNGDGRTGRAADAQGYGRFYGQGAMAILSRVPIAMGDVQDFTPLLWRDLPGALLPRHKDGTPFPSPDAQSIQRLPSSGHWAVPLHLPDGTRLTLLTFHAAPPVFDGPEDQNGRRNHDEIRFWQHYLDGRFGPAPLAAYVVLGSANLDPSDSDGRREAIVALLEDPRLQDPGPTSPGAQAGPDQGHVGPDNTDTVDWPSPGPGRLRVDYVLPSRDLRVNGSGVHWPVPGAVGAQAATLASRHRLVWVDLDLTP